MKRARRRKVVLASTAVGAGVVIVGLALIVHAHRVALFLIPGHWREVERLLPGLGDQRWEESANQLRRHLSELVRLQQPEAPVTGGLALMPLTSADGRRTHLLASDTVHPVRSREVDVTIVWADTFRLLSSKGFLVGDPLSIPGPGPPLVGEKIACDGFDLVRLNPDPGYAKVSFEIAASAAGLVPRGFVIGERYPGYRESRSMPVSGGNSKEVEAWLANDPRPALSVARIESLLRSPDVAHLHRALYEIEKHGPSVARLALALLDHPNAFLRARAAAVAANDSARCDELLTLLDGPDERVRTATHLALLNCRDVAVATESYVHLLKKRDENLLRVRFDPSRLSSPAAAKELLDWLISEWASPAPGDESAASYYRFPLLLCSLTLHDLRPWCEELLALWEYNDRSGSFDYREVGIPGVERYLLVLWLTRLEQRALDTAVTDLLAKGSDFRDVILTELLERRTPLQSDRALGVVKGIASSGETDWSVLLALLVLEKWGVPDAPERLSARMRNWFVGYFARMGEPSTIWFDDFFAQAPRPAHLEELARSFEDAEITFGPTVFDADTREPLLEPDVLTKHCPTLLVDSLLDLLAGDEVESVGSVPGILDAQHPETLRSVAPRLITAWSWFSARPQSWEAALRVYLKARDPEIDRFVVELAASERRSERGLASPLLFALLDASREMESPEALGVIRSGFGEDLASFAEADGYGQLVERILAARGPQR